MNRIIPIIILIILVLIGGGFLFLRGEKGEMKWTFAPATKVQESYADKEMKEKEKAEREIKIYNSAIESKDTTLCDAITETKLQNQCRDMITIAKALEAKDISLCDTLYNTGMTLQCRDNIHFHRAESENEESFCREISDENIRKGCLDTFAKLSMGSAVSSGSLSAENCETFSSDDLQAQCRDRLQTETDMRIYREAIESEDLARCDTIGDDTLRGKCRDALLLSNALKLGNIELCASIGDLERADYCQKMLSTRSDISRYQEAIRSGDLSACSSLSTIQMQHQCHDTIVFSQVRTTQDASLCMTLYNTGVIDRCESMVRR